MGDEAFDEVVITLKEGMVFIRGGYGREKIYLGMSHVHQDEPDMLLELTRLHQFQLLEAIEKMQKPVLEAENQRLRNVLNELIEAWDATQLATTERLEKALDEACNLIEEEDKES